MPWPFPAITRKDFGRVTLPGEATVHTPVLREIDRNAPARVASDRLTGAGIARNQRLSDPDNIPGGGSFHAQNPRRRAGDVCDPVLFDVPPRDSHRPHRSGSSSQRLQPGHRGQSGPRRRNSDRSRQGFGPDHRQPQSRRPVPERTPCDRHLTGGGAGERKSHAGDQPETPPVEVSSGMRPPG